jgi:hypothetical protein
MDNVLKAILANVAEATKKDPEQVEVIMNNLFKFIREQIDNIDFSVMETEADLRKAKTNFNIPRICKLYTTIKRVEDVKDKIGTINPPDVQRAYLSHDFKGRKGKQKRTDPAGGAGTE